MATLLWLQGGACSGNTMSFLNAEEPSACDLVIDFGIDVLWHPSLGMEMGDHVKAMLRDIASGKRPLDIFVFEGTVIRAPNGTGRFNMFADRPMKDWVTELAAAANAVVALGDCACWGGIPAMAPNPSDSIGLQYLKKNKGGYLGSSFRSKWGLPVINIPGCPSHPDWVTQILVAVASGRAKDIALDDLQRPQTFFKTFTQTGCTRVQFYEYKQHTQKFGQVTRTGMPCTGGTEPEFPFYDLLPRTVFKTQKIAGVIPKDHQTGTGQLSYLAHAVAAKIAAPQWSKEDMFVV